jgi:hypothetical protein
LTDERQSSLPRGAQPEDRDENGPAAALLLSQYRFRYAPSYRHSGSNRLAGPF